MSDEIDQLVGAVDDALREAVKKLAGARKQLDDMVGIGDAMHESALGVATHIIIHGGYDEAVNNGCISKDFDAITDGFPLEAEDVPSFLAYEAAMLGNLSLARMGFESKGIELPDVFDPVKQATTGDNE